MASPGPRTCRTWSSSHTRCRGKRPTMQHRLIAGIVTIAGLLGTAVPAMAHAKGSAEASAAAVANPKWAPPKLAWGHPDLEGIWTSDDMRGAATEPPPALRMQRHTSHGPR